MLSDTSLFWYSALQHDEITRHRSHSIHQLFNSSALAGTDTAPLSNISYHFSSQYAASFYVQYYGTWTNTQISIINTLIANIGNTTWFNIQKTYYYQATDTSPKVNTAGPLTLGGAWILSSGLGNALTGTIIPNRFIYYINNGILPNDPGGIYLWLNSASVTESNSVINGSFLTNYCGYHYRFQITGINYMYGFIGNAGRFIGQGCDPSAINPTLSPNDDLGVDAMASIIAHEIVEAMSDPFGNAWYDSNGAENADKCAWNFGTVSQSPNGANYNLLAGGRYYLIQQNWNAILQACAQSA
ncbi:unnamed protein product [Rotaria sp. Silwood2]|nr:unnamed protein product [Rotaria sp. Silwood2]